MKVPITAEGMQHLYAVAKARGDVQALNTWSDLAMQWMQEANWEIGKLQREFQDSKMGVDSLCIQIHNNKEKIPGSILGQANELRTLFQYIAKAQKERRE